MNEHLLPAIRSMKDMEKFFKLDYKRCVLLDTHIGHLQGILNQMKKNDKERTSRGCCDAASAFFLSLGFLGAPPCASAACGVSRAGSCAGCEDDATGCAIATDEYE